MPGLAVRTWSRKLSTCIEKLLRLKSMRVMKKQRGAAFLLRRDSKFVTGLLRAATTASLLNYLLKLPSPFFQELAAQLRADFDDRVSPILPLIGPAGINNRLGSEHSRRIRAGTFLVQGNGRIGGAAQIGRASCRERV